MKAQKHMRTTSRIVAGVMIIFTCVAPVGAGAKPDSAGAKPDSEPEQNRIFDFEGGKPLTLSDSGVRLVHRSQDTALPEGNRSGGRCQRGQGPSRGMDHFMPRPIGPTR